MLPAFLSGAAALDGRVDVAIGFGHLGKAGRVNHQVWAEHIQERVQILAAQLDRRCREEQHRLRVVAEVPDALMQEGVRVPQVVGLIDNDEVELGRRVQVDEAFVFVPAASCGAEHEVSIKQRKREDRPGVLFRPFPFEMGLLETVSEPLAIQFSELFVETLHLQEPLALGDQRLGADDQHGGKIHARPQLFDDQAGFDGFADADFIGDEQTGTVGSNELQHRPVLVGHERHPTGAQREEIGS